MVALQRLRKYRNPVRLSQLHKLVYVLLAVALGIGRPSATLACLWDIDTLMMEDSRFPSALELVSGKFLRHSPEFYRWRIQNRLMALKEDPENADLWDDLAVAYDKIGEHDKAVEAAKTVESFEPGRYETAANLGTFFVHRGDFVEGISHIDRALVINANAHFGREKYQKLLVEYLIHRRPDGRVSLPLASPVASDTEESDQPTSAAANCQTFAEFLAERQGNQLTEGEIHAAVNGVLGMMRFGNFDSPVLLEALGTLLAYGDHEPEQDAKMLAARAFLKASYEVTDESVRVAYRAMATDVITNQTLRRVSPDQVALERIEVEFQKELDDAQAWYATLSNRELS